MEHSESWWYFYLFFFALNGLIACDATNDWQWEWFVFLWSVHFVVCKVSQSILIHYKVTLEYYLESATLRGCWLNLPVTQWLRFRGSWGTEASSKTRVSQCTDRWVLAWHFSLTWNSKRSMCHLFNPVNGCGGAELKIAHRSPGCGPFWCYLSSS